MKCFISRLTCASPLIIVLQRLHQELIGRKTEMERLTAGACDVSDSVQCLNASQSGAAKNRSFTPPAAGSRSRTPPVTTAARSRTPPGSVARSKTPPVTGTAVRVLPSVRSQTPPTSSLQSRPLVTASQQRRSSTPSGSTAANKSAKSRVPSGSPIRRQLPSPSSAQAGGKELTSWRGSSALWERYRLLMELSASRKKQLMDALDRQQEVRNFIRHNVISVENYLSS